MINWTTCTAAEREPDRVSGTWVFRSTRVPVAALFENVEGGVTVNEFLEWFPGVTEQQVRTALEHARRSLELTCVGMLLAESPRYIKRLLGGSPPPSACPNNLPTPASCAAARVHVRHSYTQHARRPAHCVRAAVQWHRDSSPVR
jgi:uncharacterized protein (DUF433 family)